MVVVGVGPAGLYAALLLKPVARDVDATVLEYAVQRFQRSTSATYRTVAKILLVTHDEQVLRVKARAVRR